MVVENGDNGVDSEKSDAMEIDEEKGEGDNKGKVEREAEKKETKEVNKPKENGAGDACMFSISALEYLSKFATMFTQSGSVLVNIFRSL